MVFGQKGDKCGQEGVEGNLVDLGVYTPHVVVKRADSFASFFAAASLALGMGCGCPTSASILKV